MSSVIEFSIIHSNVDLLSIDPFIGRLFSLKVARMLLIWIDALNWSDILRHVGGRYSLVVRIMNEVAVVATMTTRSRMIVNTRDCFFLKIFMDLILSQQSTLIRRLVLSGDKGPLGDQRLSLSIVKLKSEFVKLLNCLMGHFEVLFHLRNL